MNNEIKNNVKQTSTWQRGFFILLFLFCFNVAEFVLFTISVVQFLFFLITGKPNSRLTKFGKQLAIYVYQIVNFLVYKTEVKPFPFIDWPQKLNE